MKLYKAHKLHTKLRIRQEVLCHKVCLHSEEAAIARISGIIDFPEQCLFKFGNLNRTVKRLQKLLPNWYFFLCDVFGVATRMKSEINHIIESNKPTYKIDTLHKGQPTNNPPTNISSDLTLNYSDLHWFDSKNGWLYKRKHTSNGQFYY